MTKQGIEEVRRQIAWLLVQCKSAGAISELEFEDREGKRCVRLTGIHDVTGYVSEVRVTMSVSTPKDWAWFIVPDLYFHTQVNGLTSLVFRELEADFTIKGS